jgi:hypothetical protein
MIQPTRCCEAHIFMFYVVCGSWYIVGDILTRLRAGPFGVQIPAGARNVSLPPNRPYPSGAYRTSYSVGSRVISSGIKLPERGFEHLPSSSPEVKNEWSCFSAPSLCVYGMNRGEINLLKQYVMLECK